MDPLLASILDAAVRAPSAHNTQPWLLRWLGDSLEVRVNYARCLPAADPSYADILHSLGAMLENILLTLIQLGYAPEYKVAEHLDLDAPIVMVWWKKSNVATPDPMLYRMIPIRRTSRLPYVLEPVKPAALDALRGAVSSPCTLHFLTDANAIHEVRSLTAIANAELLAAIPTAMELHEWIRFSSRDRRWYRDGLTAACLGWSRWEAAIAKVILSPAMLRFLTRLGLHRALCANQDQQAPPTPALCLLMVETAHCVSRIEAGRSLQRLWLTAAKFGLVTHPLNAALDISVTRDRLLDAFHASPSHHHVNLFRLGRSAVPARSPRLPADEILCMNDHVSDIEAIRIADMKDDPTRP